MKSYGIILFDGECSLCNKFVWFVIRHDPSMNFRFAPIRSEAAAQLRIEGNFSALNLIESDSILLVCDEFVLQQSDAVFAIAGGLRFPWSLLGILRILPRRLCDAIYRWIARNRHQMFGKCQATTIDSKETASRFL